jgi:uncharacterized protein involved in outer membrane biogenesis
MRLRSKIGLGAAAVLAVLAAAVGVAPYVIDVEAYKPGMIEAVREATGRELVIDGPMRLAVFPVPGIGAGQVHFSNAVGAKGAQMLDVRWVSVRPDWWELLAGRVAVGTLTLYGPTILLESDAEGRPNWEFKPGGGTTQPKGAPSAGLHLAVGRLSIVRGTVRYTNPKLGQTFVAEDVSASASVTSFEGPFNVAGGAAYVGPQGWRADGRWPRYGVRLSGFQRQARLRRQAERDQPRRPGDRSPFRPDRPAD